MINLIYKKNHLVRLISSSLSRFNELLSQKQSKKVLFSFIVLSALLAGSGLVLATSGNVITKNFSEKVCNEHHICLREELDVVEIDIPEAGDYKVLSDIHLDSIDEQLDESFYLTFTTSDGNSTVTPNDPNAGQYYVVEDVAGQEYNLGVYSGVYTFPVGKVSLNLHHYGNIWDDYPEFINDVDKDGPESVTVNSVTLKPLTLPNPCQNNSAPKPSINPINETINLGENITFSGAGSTDSDSDILSYLWKVDGQKLGTGESFVYEATNDGQYTVELYVSDSCTTASISTQLWVEVPDQCNMSLTKIDSVDQIGPGGQIVYGIHLKNMGDTYCTGNGVLLKEYYDSKTSFVSSVPAPSSGDRMWNLGEVAPGGEREVQVTVEVSGDVKDGDNIHNKVCAWAEQFGSMSDPSIWICDEEDTPVVIDQCLNNHAPVSIIDPQNSTITVGETIVFRSLSQDDDNDSLTYFWSVNELGVSDDGESTFDFTPSETGDYVVSLKVNDGCSWDVSRTTVHVVEETFCSLKMTKEANVSEVLPGDQITYTLTVENSGTAVCANDSVKLKEFYDPQINFVSSEPVGSVYKDNAWDLGAMAPGEISVVNVVVDVSQDAQGGDIIHNKACTWVSEFGDADDLDNWICDSKDVSVVTPQCVGTSAPEAVISPESHSVFLGESVSFSSEGTSDADGDTLFFTWEIFSVTSDFLQTGTGETFDITPDETGQYHVTLTVTEEGECDETTVTTILTVKELVSDQCLGNNLPVAVINPQSASVVSGGVAEFTAVNSSDVDGDELSYVWFEDGVEKHSDEIFTPDSSQVGDHIIRLVVSDKKQDGSICGSDEAEVIFTVTSGGGGSCPGGVPVPVTSGDISINLGDLATVDASSSIDNLGRPLTYFWSIPNLGLDSEDSVFTFKPDVIGTFAAQVIVRNECGQSVDSVHVTVEPLVPTIYGGDPDPIPDPPVIYGGDPDPIPDPTPTPTPTPKKPTIIPPTVKGVSDFIPPTVKGVSDFVPPVTSPRAGSPIAMSVASMGLLGGAVSGGATFLGMTLRKRRRNALGSKRRHTVKRRSSLTL